MLFLMLVHWNAFRFIFSFWCYEKNYCLCLVHLRLHYHVETICYSKLLEKHFEKSDIPFEACLLSIQNAFLSMKNCRRIKIKRSRSKKRGEKNYIWNEFVMIIMMIRLIFHPFGNNVHSFILACFHAAMNLFIFFMIHSSVWLNY